MGFLKNIFEKMAQGYIYIVDIDTAVQYMKQEEKFSVENNLEASYNYYLYKEDGKHHVQLWDFVASDDQKEREKGMIYYYDDKEYQSIDEMITKEFSDLPKYFKIELIDTDNVYLNEFKKQHPDLTEN